MKCILPYSKCVYLIKNGNCQGNGLDAPYNGDARCLRVSGRKKMLLQARAKVESTSEELYDTLRVQAYRQTIHPDKLVIRVYVGNLSVAYLKYRSGVWYLANEYENQIPMANNELDAVEAALKHLNYRE